MEEKRRQWETLKGSPLVTVMEDKNGGDGTNGRNDDGGEE